MTLLNGDCSKRARARPLPSHDAAAAESACSGSVVIRGSLTRGGCPRLRRPPPHTLELGDKTPDTLTRLSPPPLLSPEQRPKPRPRHTDDRLGHRPRPQ